MCSIDCKTCAERERKRERERERERETISFVLVACYVCALYAYTLSHSYCVWVELY